MYVDPHARRVELSRRNLLALLAKLDGHPAATSCTLFRDGWEVVAVEDAVHYADRAPGAIHPDTEAPLGAL